MPRLPVTQLNENAYYKQIIVDILVERGLMDANVELLQHYRIDLDGDGMDEVVLYAENTIESDTQEYSTVRHNYDKSAGCFSSLYANRY